jgi:TldD protein
MEKIEELKFIDDRLKAELNELSQDKIDYWDIRLGVVDGTNLDFTDQKSKEISSYKLKQCSIRTFKNGGWGFITLRELNRDSLKEKFSKAIRLAKASESLTKHKFQIKERDPYVKNYEVPAKKNLKNVDITEKIETVKFHEKTASEYSEEIKNTHSLYYDGFAHKLFFNSFQSQIYEKMSIARLFCSVYAKRGDLIQRGMNSVGGIGGFEIMETDKAKNLSTKSAMEAVELLDAKSPIGGKFTLIMDPKLTGTFIHEAFGHACEADHVLSKESILEGKIGEQVALEEVSIIDDPRMGKGQQYGLPYEFFGSYYVDDEGIPAQETEIIKDGVFKNYLHNLETSSRMDVEPNGHGRASGISSKPQVRMGITFLEPGDWTLEEMIEDVEEGVLCEDFLYGYTDPSTGNFQFKTKLSYRIENGEKKELMRDVALSGMTLEVLNRITAIGKELNFSDGMCGKGGQSVRVNDGGPFIRIKDVSVGGLR